jgi:hypothetical protein
MPGTCSQRPGTIGAKDRFRELWELLGTIDPENPATPALIRDATVPRFWELLGIRALLTFPWVTLCASWKVGAETAEAEHRQRDQRLGGMKPEGPARNDSLHWPRRDGLKWPQLASVVVLS